MQEVFLDLSLVSIIFLIMNPKFSTIIFNFDIDRITLLIYFRIYRLGPKSQWILLTWTTKVLSAIPKRESEVKVLNTHKALLMQDLRWSLQTPSISTIVFLSFSRLTPSILRTSYFASNARILASLRWDSESKLCQGFWSFISKDFRT